MVSLGVSVPGLTVARSSLLLANERIIFTSPISVRPPSSMPLPNFLLPTPKRRQLILTDFPRLISAKDEETSQLKAKTECVFAVQSGAEGANSPVSSGGGNRMVDVQEKGAKGFVVHTVSYEDLKLQ